jgi:hypothetical protein
MPTRRADSIVTVGPSGPLRILLPLRSLMPVERAPLDEAQDLIVAETGERRIEREHTLSHGRLPPAFLLAMFGSFTAAAQPTSP